MDANRADVDQVGAEEEELTQLYVRTTRSNLRAFKRLADRKGVTLSRWVLDVLGDAVSRDLDELRRSIDEAESKARRQIEADKRYLAELERRSSDEGHKDVPK